jgi:hypothetical protein
MMNDLIRYTNVGVNLRPDVVAFCCLIQVIEKVLSRHTIDACIDDYKRMCGLRTLIRVQVVSQPFFTWQLCPVPQNFLVTFKTNTESPLHRFESNQLRNV